MPTVALTAGTIHYQQSGPTDGRPIVFVHGYAMGSSLWRPLSERLAGRGFSCLAPTWPLGAHTEPMAPEAELTMESIAAMVGEFLDALSLEDVVLVGNDTGGAVSQIVATSTPERLGELVLTSCDAFEHFPPPILKPFIVAAKFGPAFKAAAQPLRTKLGRQRAFGALAHADIDQLVVEWLKPGLTDPKIREDLRRFTASMKQESTLRAAERLPHFTQPALIAWSEDDAFFPVQDGERLAATLPNARLEVITGARTFSMIDQPDRLADLIAEFASGGGTGRVESPAAAGAEAGAPGP
ncbi:MAG TPA: alpha/beta hydrolase [Candidatus Dormibacteraeota bacterium]|nr:alpha/beta hydrolase [Candidatus Dormibacteraeota bacterium]